MMKQPYSFIGIGVVVGLCIWFVEPSHGLHQLEQKYQGELTAAKEKLFEFEINSTDVLRVWTKSEGALVRAPLLTVIREGHGVHSWSLPLILKPKVYSYTSVSRTICPYSNNINGSGEMVPCRVGLSTPAQSPLPYEMMVRRLKDSEFNLKLGEKMTLNVTPSAPYYVKHKVDYEAESLVIEVTASDSICMVMAVQEFESLYHKEFYIIFVVKSNDKVCTGKTTLGSACVGYSVAIGVTLGVMVAICLSVVLITLCLLKQDDKEWRELLAATENEEKELETLENNQENDQVPSADTDVPDNRLLRSGDSYREALTITNPDNEEERTSEEEEAKTKEIAKVKLYIPDLAAKPWETTEKKYKVYYWNLIAISLFYSLPVMQLVIAFQKSWTDSGDLDVCFYNFLCIRPLIGLYAFNHVFSNVGFVFLGLVYLFIVRSYDMKHRRRIIANRDLAMSHGVQKHFGLFYTIGIALCMEGVMSACYHVCPNYTNFQFDAAFMYMLSAFGILKIYNKRHPDINAPSHIAHIVMSIVILLSVIGTVWNQTAFWGLFTVCYILLMFTLSTEFYYKGQFRRSKLSLAQRFLQETRNKGPRNLVSARYVDRALFLLVINLANFAFVVYGLVYMPSKFVSYLLSIFILNLLLYTSYYVIMKLRHGEKLGPRQWICQILAALSWGAALYFYFSTSADWEKTAAESKELNHECILLDFYDTHGIWHFLAAMSLFLSFSILLIIDDGLDCIHQRKIAVF